jgi:hypothetical protein
VYDMYHWDSSVPATEESGDTDRARTRAAGRPAAAAQAVQVALDRRDNGGDAAGPRDQFGWGAGVGTSRARGAGAGTSRARGDGAGTSRARGDGVSYQ